MKKTTLILGTFLLFLSACQNVSPNRNDECISPPIAFSQSNSEEIDLNKELLPPAPWLPIVDLPEAPNGALGHFNIALVHSRFNYDEIWIKWCWVFLDTQKNNECGYIVFRTDTNSWDAVAQQEEDLRDRLPDKLFVTKAGDIWGLRSFASGKDYSILVRYKESDQIFDPVQDLDNILNESELPSAISSAMDESGVLWMVYGKSLFNFNTATNRANKFVILEDQYSHLSHITIAPDETIYLNIDGKKELIRFSSETEKVISRITIELPVPPVRPVYGENPAGEYFQVNESFLDSKGRLWVHNYGWMASDGSWYTLLSRFSGFYGILEEGTNNYGWLLPNIIIESSDGSLWFRSSNGIVRFDPKKGNWCWITTEQTNIVEDQKNNLWMIVDGKLYMYPINP